MTRKILQRTVFVLIPLILLAAACQITASPPAPTAAPVEIPTPTGVPTQSVAVEPTATPAEEEPAKGVPAGPVTITEMGLVIEEDPYRVEINLVGTVPTPCHRLKWTIEPSQGGGRVDVEVLAVADPDQNCIQVLASFEQRIPLTGLEPGEYEVYVNGEPIGSVSFPAPE
jgi:hypothetical protein